MSLYFLIGMPGAGKTYWGRLLAENYGLAFIDLDKQVEQGESRSVSEIFTTKGEEYFRKKETQCLQKLSREKNTIVACGGGTPIYNDNMAWMKENGCVVYLMADINNLSGRIEHDNTRPLLNGSDIKLQLEGMFNARKPYYEQAHYSVRADESIIAKFGEIIELCTGRH